MSQILRLTQNLHVKSLPHFRISLASDFLFTCKGCQNLRNEFSTNPNLKPQSIIYKKKKWKKRENLYKKLSQSLDARLVQLSASPGNQLISQRDDQSLFLLGNKTSKDGRVEQNVYYVGNSFNSKHIAELEKEIELLRGQKGTHVPAGSEKVPQRTQLTSDSELLTKPKAKLKDSALQSLTSTVMEQTNQELKASSVIKDHFNTDVEYFTPKLKDASSGVTGSQTSNAIANSIEHVPKGELTHALAQGKADVSTSVIQFQDYDNGIKKLWTDEVVQDRTVGEHLNVSEIEQVEYTGEKRKKKKRRKLKPSEVKVVSKPAHVKTVNIATTPIVVESTHIKVASSGKTAFDRKGNIVTETGNVQSVKPKPGAKSKHILKKTEAKTKTVANLAKKLDLGDQAAVADSEKNIELDEPVSNNDMLSEKKKTDSKAAKWQKSSLEGAILIFNQDFRSFVDACCYVGLYKNALDLLHHYRNLRKSGYKKFSITDVGTYNSIIQCLADKGDLKGIQELMAVMNEDTVKPDLRTHALSLYCLGRNESLDPVLAQYIVSDMEKEGFDVKDVFTKVTFIGRERETILKVLQKVVPGFELPAPEDGPTYSGPLVEELNAPLPRSEMVEPNPYLGVITPEEVIKKSDVQFKRELNNYVYVRSIAKPSAIESVHGKHKKTKKPAKEKLEKLKKHWRHEMTKEYRLKLQKLEKKLLASQNMSLYPFLKLLPEEVYIDMLMKEVEYLASVGEFYSPPVTTVYKDLAQKVCDRFHVQFMADNKIIPKMKTIFKKYTEKIMDPNIEIVNHRTCWMSVQKEVTEGRSLEIEEKLWSPFIKKALGKELYDIIFSRVKVPVHQRGSGGHKKMVPAFVTVIRPKELFVEEEIKPHPEFLKIMGGRDELMFQTAELPMLIPPLPWVSPTQGCNFFYTSKTIRWHIGQQMKMFKAASDTGPVLDSLNVLGACPWKVNKPVLDVIIKVFNSGGDEFLDIPILPTSIEKPLKPKGKLSREEKGKAYKEKLAHEKRVNEANSLWYSSLYKLSIANHFRDEIFWFPHNMDFRGRTYALPPHFNQLGGDTARAIIKFAKGKPLGPNGLDWLKIHLVNLTGLKKRCSLKERLAFANEMMEEILDSADKPLDGRRWWTFSEEPWQTLACCMEIAEASRSEDPAQFVSGYPVHQDGSCNGLQHYAALGRDTAGAKSVNLYPFDTPSDVYQEVVELVEKKRQRDLIEGDEKTKTAAKICEGHVERKVIKQTIMTTVYGVTKYGARLQIAKQLKERDMPKEKILLARTYLADSTFYCLQQMFSSAKQIQDWFNACAVNICSIGRKPVEWVTPLNFPVVQPYFRQLRASSYGVSVTSSTLENQYPSVVKQKNAFAPNYIHSLDSTHMMLTSLYCLRAGITFVSVHDCFWTHPCDVEVMNKVTREQFISLHNQPILENLSKYFVKTYCDTYPKKIGNHSLKEGSQAVSNTHSCTSVLNKADQSNNFSLVLDTRHLDQATGVSHSNVTSGLDSDYSNNAFTERDVKHPDFVTSVDEINSDHSVTEDISCWSSASSEFEIDQSEEDLEVIQSCEPSSQEEEKFSGKEKFSEDEKMIHLHKVLTSVPDRGDFDLEKVKESTYFFS